MRIVCDKRQTGKTIKLIKACAKDPNGLLICAINSQVKELKHKAFALGYDNIKVTSIGQLFRQPRTTKEKRRLYIDEAGICLSSIIIDEIAMLTISRNESYESILKRIAKSNKK